jgi:subtilisin family serine protease
VLVLDTGLPAGASLPRSLTAAITSSPNDQPDYDGDGRLDPVAGHGTFIAGIVSRLAPGCRVIVHPVLTGFGDGRESVVASVLRSYAGRVDLVNLSFGTYTPYLPLAVARAVRAVQRGIGRLQEEGAPPRPAVVVASAGNDGTWVAPFPAVLPDVVAVAALGPAGPAWFSNYGPWVRACAPGVEVVSTFFLDTKTDDGRPFDGWACWSGTSFAAPVVVGALARTMIISGLTDPRRAVRRVIDAPGLLRLPCHGTVVNEA